MPWLYHRYVGHDINRDAFMMNMAENRSLADFFYRRWHPQVFLTMHQMGPRGPRFFVPPNSDPIDPNYDPLIWRTAGLLGHAMALALEEDGRAGVRAERALRLLLARLRRLGAARPQHGLAADRSGQRARRDADHRAGRINCTGAPRLSRSLSRPRLSRIRGPAATGRCATSSTTTCRRRAACSAPRRAIARTCVRNFYRMGRSARSSSDEGRTVRVHHPARPVRSARGAQARQLLIDGAVEVQRTLEPFRVAETVYPQAPTSS